jgi:pimeloyl-ACP methyl ester carboxylesterase
VVADEKVEWDRIPIILQFPEVPKFAETYGFVGSQGVVMLEGQRFVPRDRPSDTVYIFMHPTTTLQLLPMPKALADVGLHVICAASRYPKNDSALIMEKVCFDLGMYVRWAKEQLGYRHVVLVGWSGGGSLSLFYQSQAERPTITHTPAGDPYDLTAAKLQPADGVILIAAHLSRADSLTESLDPSIINELDPDDRDMEMDIYAADCPHQPPYSADFVRRFRAAQLGRNRKITAWVQDTLERLKRKDDGEVERAFIVHRTMCDVRWLDLTIDPNGRRPGTTHLGNPRVANAAPAGLARFSTLRSWLSQWSYDHSHARGAMCAAGIRNTPVFQIQNQADESVPATHNPIIHEALATSDKEMLTIAGATHYYVGQPEQLAQCTSAVQDWSRRKNLLA